MTAENFFKVFIPVRKDPSFFESMKLKGQILVYPTIGNPPPPPLPPPV